MRYDTILRLSESIVNRHKGGFTFFHGVSVDKNTAEDGRFPLVYLLPVPSIDVSAGEDRGSRAAYDMTLFVVGILSPDRKPEEVDKMLAQYHTAAADIVGEFRRYGELGELFNGEIVDFEITTEADYLPIIDDDSTNMTGCQVSFTISDNIEREYCVNDNFTEALEVNELNQLIIDDRGNAISVSDATINKVIACLPVTITDGGNEIEVESGGTYTCQAGGGEDATVENSDQSFSDTVASGGTLVLDDITHTQTDGSPEILPAQIALVCTPQIKSVFLKGLFASGNDTMETITIDADNAGTYTSITDDGSSGAITLNINGGGDNAFVNPTVLGVSDTVVAKRATDTATGFYKITGTHA